MSLDPMQRSFKCQWSWKLDLLNAKHILPRAGPKCCPRWNNSLVPFSIFHCLNTLFFVVHFTSVNFGGGTGSNLQWFQWQTTNGETSFKFPRSHEAHWVIMGLSPFLSLNYLTGLLWGSNTRDVPCKPPRALGGGGGRRDTDAATTTLKCHCHAWLPAQIEDSSGEGGFTWPLALPERAGSDAF